jgi:integrase
VADSPHAPLLRLAAMTGLRRGELCGVRWSDVDLDAGRLRVRQTITTFNHQPAAGDVKSARSRRVVDLDQATVASLRVWATEQKRHRLMVSAGWADTGLVFTMPDGRGWHPDVVTRAFDRLARRAGRDLGLPRITLHGLRHSHATHLLAAGANVRMVSERLGHASTAFTLDVYGHVLDGQQADAAAAVARLVDFS